MKKIIIHWKDHVLKFGLLVVAGFMQQVAYGQYCTPSYNTACAGGMYIEDFILSGENGTSITEYGTGCSTGYDDRTYSSVQIYPNSTYSAQVYSGANYAQGVAAWIDFNDDGVFDNATERVGDVNMGDYGTLSLTIPAGVPLGLHRMRVMLAYNYNSTYGAPITDPCTPTNANDVNMSFGETEDYMVEVLPKPNCSGLYSAGIINATSFICPGFDFALENYASLPNLDGLTGTWQSSTDGTNWNDVATTIATTYNLVGGISQNTDFRFVATCSFTGDSDISSVVSVAINTNPTECYYSDNLCLYGMNINNVRLAGVTKTLDNTSSCTSYNYENHTSTTTIPNLAIDSTYLFEISTNFMNSGNDFSTEQNISAWIDYDNDGVFANSEEIASTNGGGFSGGTGSFNFTVPSSATPGNYTMRVRMAFRGSNNPIDPTAMEEFGETEDYTVEIFQMPSCNLVTGGAATASSATICGGSDFDLSVSGNSGPATSLTSIWQSSPVGENTWTNIAGATTSDYTLVGGITASTDFRYFVSCAISGEKDSSNVVTVVAKAPTECYCEPVYTYGCQDLGAGEFVGINDFMLTGENGTEINDFGTGCSTNSYDDRTTESVDVYANNTYSAYISSNAIYAQGATVWIDFNDNGVFESSEMAGTNLSVNAAGTVSISIPSGATLGSHRMRVMLAYNYIDGVSLAPITDACSPPLDAGNASYGEVHDYTVNILCNPNFVVNLGADDAYCVGTAYTKTLDAGTFTDVTYTWSDGSTNQTLVADTAGTYSVVVALSNGCTAKDTVVITENALPVVNLGLDTAICTGSTLTLDAQNTGSTFTWSDNSTAQTFAVTTAGTYNVTVEDANGCIGTDAINVSINALPVVNLGLDTVICAGNTVTLNAQNTGATFTWSDNSSAQTLAVTATGEYSVIVENANGCIGKDTIVVTINALPIVNLGLDTAICAGATLTLDAQNTGSTFTWSDNSTAQTLAVTTAGTYSVTVTNANGCIAKDTVVVTTNPLPTAGSLSATNDVCAFDFGVTGVAGATSYEWNFGDNNTATTTTAFTSHEYENEGTYTVTVKVKNACGEVEKQVEVTCNEVSVKDVANANRIAMYPNPTSSVVTLDASVEMTEITVVDNLGKVVYRVSPNHTMSYQMNVSELSNGFYTVIITTNSGVVTKKLEVTK
ncbi:MAG TPA: GEVED domain-containing protein [Crocinitomicaceae bacterium]|nr:GEVED domain-containing protein [Crocinitomicaceae bacterium]